MNTMLNGRRYSDEQRDAVFTVWAFVADRNCERTSRLIKDDPACVDLAITECTPKTVLNWVNGNDWPTRADRMLHANAPRARFETQVSLILAAPEAGRFMRDLINLDESLKTEKTFQSPEGPVTVKVFDDRVLKLRLTGAVATLDRTGFSPIGTRDKLGNIDEPPTTEAAQALADTMNTDELKEHEQYIRKRLGIGRGN